MRSVAAAVLLVTRRIDFGVATLSEGGVTSGLWIPQNDECPPDRSFLGRRSVFGNSWTIFSGRNSAWRTLLSIFGSFWWERARVLILVQVRNWPLHKRSSQSKTALITIFLLFFLFFLCISKSRSGFESKISRESISHFTPQCAVSERSVILHCFHEA